ncbi:MAG: glycosyltransferase [Sphingomonas aquatilis]|uniref:glycosyltransferase n=1 Tax=Sphingomonas aquatilis TaxID=93063 RepID=UPI002F314BFB
MDWITAIIDAAARESMLFAAAGLLIGGLDDLIVDLCFLVRRGMGRGAIPAHLDRLPAPTDSGCLAIFVAAWDEQAVIGQMLATAVARIDHPDYRLYVGVYPNDPGTIAAARAVAATDPRIRVIVGPRNGPTTKADCLNSLWRALVADAACGWSGNREGGRGGIQWDRVGSIGLDIAENGGWAVHARAFRGCWPIRRRRSQFGWRGRGDRWADEAHFPIPGSAAFPVCRSARFARELQASYIGDATRVTR